MAYLQVLLSRRHDIAVYPSDALDRDAPPEGMYLYRPAEVLLPVSQVELFTVTAKRLGIRYWRLDEQSDELRPDAIARFAIGVNADLDIVLDRLVRAAGAQLRVTPNHVLLTCPVWGLSPAGEPLVADTLPTPKDDGDPWDVIVAVIDSGLPEGFAANQLLAGVDVAPGDEEQWAYAGPHPVLTFPQGHGSFVAGVVRLVAPRAQVRSYLAADQDGVTDEWYLGEQIDLALADGPSVVNLSLGATSRHDEPLMGLGSLQVAASAESGPIVVAAAGNLDSQRPFWPAAEPWVIGVAAVEMSGDPEVLTRAWFSDYGPWVDVCAVGVDVVSAYEAHPYRPLTDPSQLRHFKGAAIWSGTSFATPRVAAAVAGLRASDPTLSRDRALALFAASGVDVPGIGTFVE
ncbi:MAG: S8/S53 family peptidase [Acidimicrobiales bacterium]